MNVHDERCIPWDPIPHEYNRLSDLFVTHFGEVRDEPTIRVACTISSFLPEDASKRRHRWRIIFAPYAYRLNPMGEWREALPLTWPPEFWSVSKGRHVALWEITSSNYVTQSVDQRDRDEAHHYVLMNHDMAYEVIAWYYRVEDLGPTVE